MVARVDHGMIRPKDRSRRGPQMSATPDSTFTDPKQRIADLERQLAEREAELAERTAERDEALEQQTATAEVLGVINSSGGDLAPVFEAMLERAARLCSAGFGALWIYDGEQFRAAAVHAMPAALADYVREPLPARDSASLVEIVRGQAVVHVPDLAATELYRAGNPVRRAYVDLGGARTLLTVALRKDTFLLGAFNIYRQEVRPFSDKEIRLVENFAAQAVIAMENARLLTETREALEQQTATAEVLQVINSSPRDLAPVFDAMLERALRLCEAAFGVLHSYDGELFHHVATQGESDLVAFFRQTPALRASTDSITLWRVVRGERFVHILDCRDTDEYREKPLAREIADRGRMRTLLTVPLRKEDALLGTIHVYRQQVRPFTDKQIALLQNFAAQAVIAMENARLLTETREALEQQTATAEVLQVINASPGNLAPVFDAILQKATQLCEAAVGTLVTYDGERFTPAAAYGVPPAFAAFRSERGAFAPPPGNSLERVANGESLVHIADVATDPGQAAAPLVQLGGCRSLVCVALRKDNRLVGAITAYRQELRPFTDKQIALLQNFAAQAVIAMENARLLTETREALDQQTATAEILGVINSS